MDRNGLKSQTGSDRLYTRTNLLSESRARHRAGSWVPQRIFYLIIIYFYIFSNEMFSVHLFVLFVPPQPPHARASREGCRRDGSSPAFPVPYLSRTAVRVHEVRGVAFPRTNTGLSRKRAAKAGSRRRADKRCSRSPPASDRYRAAADGPPRSRSIPPPQHICRRFQDREMTAR